MTDQLADFESFVRSLSAISADPGRLGDLHERFGEFCHTLRNRLQSLNLTLYMARRSGAIPPEACTRVEGFYQKFERLVDQLQWTCRPAEVQAICLPLGMLVEERRGVWDERFAAKDCRMVVVEAVDEDAGWFDPCRLGLALDALSIWRAEVLAPGSIVEIGWRVRRGQFQFDWAETGEPLDPNPPEAQSLALAMLGRAMADHRGSLSVANCPDFAVSLRWGTESVPQLTPRPQCITLTEGAVRA